MRERAEQRVAAPEHGARADDGRTRKFLLDHAFATAARADVSRSGLGIGTDSGHENEARSTGRGRLPRERLGASLVHGIERYAPCFDIRGNGIDHGIDSRDGGDNRAFVAHVGTEDRDPVQARRAQSGARAIGMSDRDAHRRSLVNEALHDAPTEKAGAPEHADRGHGIRFATLDAIDASTAFHLRRSLLRVDRRTLPDMTDPIMGSGTSMATLRVQVL